MLLAFLFFYFLNIVYVDKKFETNLQYFDIYFHNKNILEQAQILVTGDKFMIFDIEGYPNSQTCGKKYTPI